MATTQASRRTRKTSTTPVAGRTLLADVANLGELLKRLGNIPAVRSPASSHTRDGHREGCSRCIRITRTAAYVSSSRERWWRRPWATKNRK